MDETRQYRETIVTYLKDRKLFEKYIYFTPQDPATFVSTADYIKGINNVPDHFDALDLKEVPPFVEVPAGIDTSLKDSFTGIAALILISIILFSGSILIFNRYQLR